MADEQFRSSDENEQSSDASASATFLEIMRRQAAANQPPAPVEVDVDTAPQPENKREPEPVGESSEARRERYAAAMEAQRVRRVKRRRARRRRQTVGVLGGVIRSFIIVFAAAIIMATIFTWWTPAGFIDQDVRDELGIAQATSQVTSVPTAIPTPNWMRKVGIVSGHRGPELDPGAVCPDGLTEAEINFDVSQRVVRNLRSLGYSVDLLDEFDARLDNYQAAALISIHSNSCQDYGRPVSGYLISAAASRVTARGADERLVQCVASTYERATGLPRHPGVTVDMTDYHSFREIHALTPAAIMELGFMFSDRELLTQQPDVIARAITDGILCFFTPPTESGAPTLVPTAIPTLETQQNDG